MILVSTGLVFIIAGGIVRLAATNPPLLFFVPLVLKPNFGFNNSSHWQVRDRPLDPSTDKDTTLGIALAVLGAYL
jgi:hypothetical protein